MSDDQSVTVWLDQLKAEDSAAADKLWTRYVARLVRLASRKLGNLPRRAADEEDVVLSAFHGFLAGVRQGRFTRLDDRDDLWQILVMLTERKAIGLRRRELADKRGAGQVRGDSILDRNVGDGESPAGIDGLPGCEPTPELAAEIGDQLEALLHSLADPLLQRVAVLRLEGYANKEVAEQLDIGLRAVERKLAIIRRKWVQDAE